MRLTKYSLPLPPSRSTMAIHLDGCLRFCTRTIVAALTVTSISLAAELAALPEYLRADPFGGIVAADSRASGIPTGFHDTRSPLSLAGARNGYISFQIVVKLPEGGNYRLGT